MDVVNLTVNDTSLGNDVDQHLTLVVFPGIRGLDEKMTEVSQAATELSGGTIGNPAMEFHLTSVHIINALRRIVLEFIGSMKVSLGTLM